ncbi:hypothetical protein [Burkholderia gladioli]|uniref:hypothetical protein n=1 Tax=Burkholderia gladioli TaxID=28095 RepID=UPI0016403642|nr:hypothetical protein [Burkholderia gladioli]
MAGRPVQLDHVREAFEGAVDSALALVNATSDLPTKINPNIPIGLHLGHKRYIIELAFMGVVAAWEEFLERALVRYVANGATRNGYRPTPKFGLANSIEHAYQFLSRDTAYDPSKDYLKANDPKWVWTTADFVFSSHPFSCLQTKASLLRHASSIRNRVAHDSQKCKADFKRTAIDFLRPAGGTLVQGYSAGRLLEAPVQRHFGATFISAGNSHFEAYLEMFVQLAADIVP